MSTPNAANNPTPPTVKTQARHQADPIHHKTQQHELGPKGQPSLSSHSSPNNASNASSSSGSSIDPQELPFSAAAALPPPKNSNEGKDENKDSASFVKYASASFPPSAPSAPSFVNSTPSFPPSAPSAQTIHHDDHDNDKIFDECAVENVSDVNEDTIKNAIELFRRENNNGEVEDVKVVLVRKGVTVEELVALVEKYEYVMKTLKLEIREGRTLIIMECTGRIHAKFVSEVFRQVGNYVRSNLPRGVFSAMMDGVTPDLNGTNPDVTIEARTSEAGIRCRVVIEIEHRNRGIKGMRRRGQTLFDHGGHYMRAFVGIKLIGDATGMSAIAVCYCKNDTDDIEITDAVSFGSVEASVKAFTSWATPLVDGLDAVQRTSFRRCPHPLAAAEIEIPLRACCYEVPEIQGNDAGLAAAGLGALRIDLRDCFTEATFH